MGRKTSVFLSDELIERWHASGLSLSALVRLGLEAPERDIEARVGRAALEAAFGPGHTAPMRHTASEVHTADGVDTVPDTAATATPTVRGEAGSAPKAGKASRRTEPRATPPAAEAAISSLPDLPVPLTVASALPKPKRCPHPGTRMVGGWCDKCDHLIATGGLWVQA